MLELKLPRLLAAAKEFNVGQDTIVDFLVGKGFSREDLKPTAKLTEDMYRSLQHQFQGDKVAKNKADLVEIPKGVQQEGRKKRDEEEITFNRKEFPKPIVPAMSVSVVQLASLQLPLVLQLLLLLVLLPVVAARQLLPGLLAQQKQPGQVRVRAQGLVQPVLEFLFC